MFTHPYIALRLAEVHLEDLRRAAAEARREHDRREGPEAPGPSRSAEQVLSTLRFARREG